MKKLGWLVLGVLLLSGCSQEKDLFQKAQLAASKGDIAQAVQQYSYLLKKNPRHYAALVNRGILLERLPAEDNATRAKNRQMAEQDYLAAIEVDPLIPEAYNNLGALYIDENRNEEAVFYLSEALERNPRYFTAQMNRGIANSKMGRTLEALADFNRAGQLRPNDPLLLLNRALVYYQMGQYESAINTLERLIALEPDNARAYLEHARALIRLGYPAQAYADLEQAVALKPSYALAYYYMGDLMFRRGEKEAALGLLSRAKELADQYAPAYELMGDMLSIDDPVLAVANYAAAKKLDPSHAGRYDAKMRLMRSEAGRERVQTLRFFPREQ